MKAILFDLDGTLTDSGEGIRNGAQFVLHYYGLHEPNPERLNRLIGPPLPETMRALYGVPEADDSAIEQKFREYYTEKGIFENRVYDGVREALEELKSDGFSLFVATSKPQFMAEKVLEHFSLTPLFLGTVGATRDLSLVHKPDIIRTLLVKYEIAPENAAMVGDRKYDMIGAFSCGVLPNGAAWGYGSKTELLRADAAFVAESPDELPPLFASLVF